MYFRWSRHRLSGKVMMFVRRPTVASMVVLVIVGVSLTISAQVAAAHSVSGDYNSGYCYGAYWSEPVSGHVDAGMNDNPVSSSLGLCKASQVLVRMRDYDNTLVTESDYDSLMPLAVEVDTLYQWIGYTKHQSKEPDNSWHTITINH